MANKTVYVFGAGFSMNAGAPGQARLIEEIYNLRTTYTRSSQAIVQKWIDHFDRFLKNSLFISEGEKYNYTLEDIFTPIDRSISENISFRNHTHKAHYLTAGYRFENFFSGRQLTISYDGVDDYIFENCI